jgi:hypothetical protein
MLEGIIYGLITAWILTWFDVDEIFIDALKMFLPSIPLNTNHFYVVCAIIGCANGLISNLK